MSKFKIGDRVRILRNRNSSGIDIGFTSDLKIGDIVSLTGKTEHRNSEYDGWWIDRGCQWMRSDDLELVEHKPVTTPEYSCIRVVPPSKPKREIVSGVVKLNQSAQIRITPVDYPAVDIVIDDYRFSPEALREAAALFTTLAEVLEENSNA